MSGKTDPADIVEQLMDAAHEVLDSRLCSEFGPAGGNPKAKLEDSIEYIAAKEIVRLRLLVNNLQKGNA